MPERTPSSARNRKRCVRIAVGLVTAGLALPTLLLPTIATAAEEGTAARKYGRGLAGMVLGFLEVPGNIVQETRTNGAVSGLTIGFAMGLGKLVVREITGVYDFVTAPFPVPSGFQPVLQPEFPWQYFESSPGRIYGFSDRYLYEEELELDGIPDAVVTRRAGAIVVSFPGELLFAFNSAELSEAATARLEELAKTLRAHPDSQIVVQGYADSTGDSAYNRDLSVKRAKAVRAFLIDKRVAAHRIEPTGYGDSYPVASNDTPAGRANNRRVEVEVRGGGVGLYR